MPDLKDFVRRLRWVSVGVVVVYWGAMFLGTHLQLSGPVVTHGPGDKTMHLVAYAGLTLLWLVAAATFGRVTWPVYLIALAGAAMYGAVDEWSQGLVGRTTDLVDWYYDLAGATLGVSAFLVLYAACQRFAPSVVQGEPRGDRHSD